MGSDTNCGTDYGLTENRTSTSEYAFQGYDEPYAFKGFINYKVFYKTNGTQKITKPIIIIDGFDPGDKRQVLPCDYPPLEYKIGESRAISDVMKYGVNKEKDLIKELQDKGYDVIIVNQPTYYIMNTPPYQIVPRGTAGSREIDGGGDYIERNGLNLVSLIQKINTELTTNGSAEKLVIVGPSMGGQISRYALAYMEKNNIPHNTRLWVSVDSPHLGANIPLGVQAEINLLKSSNDQAKDYYDKQLGSVAARQQLIEFHKEIVTYVTFGTLTVPLLRKVDQSLLNARTISQGFSTNSGSSFFQNFYNNQFSNGLPNSKGYPMNLRKIALVNGSLTGSKTGSDSQQTMNIRGFADVCFAFCFKIHAASMEIYTMPTFSNTSKIARFKSAFTDKNTFAPNLNSRGNMDIIPGGYFDSYNQLHNSIMGQSGPTTNFAIPFHIDLSAKDINLESRTNTKIHSFIPTFSALGMKNPDQDWGQSLNRNLVCSGETPFDSYYGETDNTEHTSFNYTSVAWLFKELGDNINPPIAQAPTFPLQENFLTGPDSICSETTFSFSDTCKIPSTATWTVSGNLQIISSTGYSVTVNQIWNSQGAITATFQNGQTLTKTLQAPDITILTAEEDDVCFQYNNYDGMVVYGSVTGVQFSNFNSPIPSEDNLIYAMSNGLTTDGLGRKYLINVPKTLFGEQIFYDITYTNQCGEQITKPGDIPIIAYECSSYLRTAATVFTIYPNPSSTTINVALFDETKAPAKKANIIGKLYDLNNTEKRKVVIKNNSAQIDTSGLNRGVYILKIDIDGKVENHQVIVK